jgi:hypothetical protein
MKHIKIYEDFLNEASTDIKPNSKLKSATGYPYVMFYLSTQAENIMIDFKNPGHVELIKLLATEAKTLKEEGELSPSQMQKGRSLFKKVLDENVAYSKYDGADCIYRLSHTPYVDLAINNQEWYNDNESMAKFI